MSYCTLLQWALPQLHLRWAGFRKVRSQVCKRIDRRCRELGLPDVVVRNEHRAGVEFLRQDIQAEQPAGIFHLILCRNLVLTYFEESLQGQVLEQIIRRLHHGGALVIGRHEQLPAGVVGVQPWFPQLDVYQRINETASG